jgi:hypothetical protein
LTVGGSGSQETNRAADARDKEERSNIASYVQLQAREIESLRIELFMLKRKDTSSLSMSAPLPPASSTDSNPLSSQSQSFLPPIPGLKKA